MAVVDLAEVCSHIHYRNIDGVTNKTTFKLTVTDRLQQTTETITVTVDVEQRTLEISNPSVVYVDEHSMSFDINSNGPNVRDIIIQYKDQLGIWKDLEILSRKQVATAEGSYGFRYEVKGIPEDIDIELRAAVVTIENGTENTEVETFSTITRTERPFRLVCDENDIFARSGKLTITTDEGDLAALASKAKLELKTVDEGTFATPEISKEGIDFTFKNLTPGTKYKARLNIDGAYSRYVTFTTESALQIPNSNMENWSVTAHGDHWERYAVDGWATYNIMTTYSGGDFAYVRRSGTVRSNDFHQGQYAAELRTVGWGSGNGAVGSVSSTNIHYLSKGMLYLGESPTQLSNLSQQATQGVDFSSRPSSITFWYKYEPHNEADYGGMKIWVKDADGNIIAEGKPAETLNKREYTQVKVPLVYEKGCKKAASIYVEFSSSDHPNYDTRSSSWLVVPAFGGNFGNSYCQGSSMFVDAISLTY